MIKTDYLGLVAEFPLLRKSEALDKRCFWGIASNRLSMGIYHRKTL